MKLSPVGLLPIFWVAVTVVMTSGAVALADSSAMLTSVEGTQAGQVGNAEVKTEGVASSDSVSRASIVESETRRGLPISLSDLSMIMGPSFDTMSTNPPSSAHPYSGVGTRHLVRMDYGVSDRVVVSPILDVTDNFYDSKQGRLIFNDPSVRVSILNVTNTNIGSAHLDAAIWVSGYAPTSQVSQSLNQYGATSVAYVPKMHFRGSRFFLTGIGQVKASFLENQSQTGMIAPTQLLAALQTNYRVSPTFTYFLMDHINGNVGPNTALVSSSLASENYRKKLVATQSVFDCLQVGVQIDVMKGVELSPRLDWLVNVPVSETTVGLNASFHLI